MRPDGLPLPTLRFTTLKQIKRVVIAIVGGTVLALGLVLIVLPGPAFLVLPAGLALLALEFTWARRWLRSARALLLRRSQAEAAPRKKLTRQSIQRSARFLLRQVRLTLLPNRHIT